MLDRLAVHELIHRWWFAFDEGQFDVWPELLTEDVHITSRSDTGNSPYEEFIASDNRGREQVIAWQRQHREAAGYPLRHNASNIHIERIDGDDISVVSYMYATNITDGQVTPIAGGVVRCVVRSDGAAYRLAELHIVLDTHAVAFTERQV
ncbi:nuclear transport factor 2 family protein [Streptomyces rhizosphaericus]|uniref:Nuclear transport factor 2 family protein n=1 Tax=Streptomyces rhizosphaericus TaxID=114699 RepID=A0A6G4A9Q7_9ACTN|nr:nuclear transport factor 2 family protein [Streptomyces rhizosphaericus]NEW69429.1 nuclear transport factor 2 family protein [Streptomyces rhizosphaericus]